MGDPEQRRMSEVGSPRAPEGLSVRASDVERETVADALSFHCAAGRLRVDELEQRLAAALSAASVGELRELLHDLPGQPAVDRPSGGGEATRIKVGLPGVRSFRQDHDLASGREVSFRQAVQDILPAMVADGFDVVSRVPSELLVFQRRDERVVVAFKERENGGTRLVVQGAANRHVRKAFANLTAD